MTNLVVKSNQLNSALQSLSLAEIHIIQLGIVDARETGNGLSSDNPLRIDGLRYAEVFGTTRQNAYKRLKEAEENLFNRRFSYTDKEGLLVKSRWIGQVRYLVDVGAIEIWFTPAVVDGISRINGVETFFTSYLLEQTAMMNSNYSVRLYELIRQWKNARKTPLFKLEEFRGQLGIGVDEYKAMNDFKKRILERAIKEINEKSDLKISYEQVKKGRSIIGFKFSVLVKEDKQVKNLIRDSDTPDMFNGMTEKQIETFASKLAHDDTFSMSTFVAPVGADMNGYILSVKQNLASIEFQKKWAKDLKRVGFKLQ